jgi:membrane-associated phospholipid phosphatase
MLFPARSGDTAVSPDFPPPALIWGIPATLIIVLLALHAGSANQALFSWLNGLSRYTGDPIWANITLLGEGLLAFTLLGPIAARRPDIAWTLLLAGLIATVAVHGLKDLFAQPRPLEVLAPSQIHVIGPSLYAASFPSGHATAIATLTTTLALYLRDRRGQFALATVAIVVAASRAVVGAHWPVDILAGLALGWLVAMAGAWLGMRLPQGLTRPWQTLAFVLSLWAAWIFWDAPTGQVHAQLLQRGTSLVGGVLGVLGLINLWLPRRGSG